MIVTSSFLHTPIGRIKLDSTPTMLHRLYLPGLFADKENHSAIKTKWHTQLEAWFDNASTPLEMPTFSTGTKFQQSIWHTLCQIPLGQTFTYAEIAHASGHPKAARAVGNACTCNPLPIIVPCHRVVAKHDLGGYAGGIQQKKWLLAHEHAAIKNTTSTPINQASQNAHGPIPPQ